MAKPTESGRPAFAERQHDIGGARRRGRRDDKDATAKSVKSAPIAAWTLRCPIAQGWFAHGAGFGWLNRCPRRPKERLSK